LWVFTNGDFESACRPENDTLFTAPDLDRQPSFPMKAERLRTSSSEAIEP
jgi:hypothetical protein